MDNIIALPAARVHCQCGKRLAPHPLASKRMGMPDFRHSTIRCECGCLVLDEGCAESAPLSLLPEDVLCAKCHSALPDGRVEVSVGEFEYWCIDCIEAEDERSAWVW